MSPTSLPLPIHPMSGQDDMPTGAPGQTAPPMARIDASNSSGSVQQHTIWNAGGGGTTAGSGKEERQQQQGEAGDDTRTSLAEMRQQMRVFMEHTQQQIASMHQLIVDGAVGRASATRQTADTLPTPVPVVRHARFVTRPVDRRRSSIGLIPEAFELEATPIPDRRAAGAAREEAKAADEPVRQAQPDKTDDADRLALKEALYMAKGHVEPFYADSSKDKDSHVTVTSFVEKIETVMGDCYLPYHLRLAMVRWFLREGALRWMNKKLVELQLAADRDGRDTVQHPFSWDGDVRAAFIQAHMGTDTVELWLAKLSLLELGKKKKLKNPIELESQFDNIARHVYPAHTADDDRSELLLASKYSEIIQRCEPALFSHIVYSTERLVTLKDWKDALVRAWNARDRIEAAGTLAGVHQGTGGHRGGWQGGSWSSRGRGGRGEQQSAATGRGATNDARQSTLNAVEADGNASNEGQPSGEQEAGNAQQLSAATGQRGGRGGGRGGRGGAAGGRGGGRPPMSEERLKLYEEQRCFRCKDTGHIQRYCPQPPVPRQSNSQADQ